MKKIIKYVLTFSLVIGLLFCVNNVKADSGWDYDYDSDWGSSWDSDYDSDWGSSWDDDWDSDYDSDWDSDNNYNYSGGNADVYGLIVFLFVLFVICPLSLILRRPKYSSYKPPIKHYKTYASSFIDLPNNVVIMTGMSSNEFKYLAFNIYKRIQNAWSDFDYDTLRKLTTDELYNTYKMQLEALKLKNQKNIMTDIERLNVKINDIKVENGIISVETYMNVRMYDYVVDSKGKVIRGTKKRKANIEYLITFVKSNNVSKETICPNCGANVNIVSGENCEYCGSSIVIDSKEFVMSKKKCINQRME